MKCGRRGAGGISFSLYKLIDFVERRVNDYGMMKKVKRVEFSANQVFQKGGRCEN
jgi:hypothetical protein